MVCPNCRTVNESSHVFCVNCGVNFNRSQSNEQDSTNFVTNSTPNTGQQQNYGTNDSAETVFVQSPHNQSVPNFIPDNPNIGRTNQPAKKRMWLALIAIPVLLLFVAVGGGAIYLASQEDEKAQVVPEDFGFYFLNDDRTELSDIGKMDVTNALETKEKLMEDKDLPELKSKPDWILFAEKDDISLSDLRLIEIDSIKDDGTLKQIEFQAAPIEGKSDMRKLRVKNGLATGKYAFAIFDGYLNEGNHRFWAFEVKSGTKSDNGDLAETASISIKKEEKPQIKVVEKKEVPAPPGARVAYVIQGNVIMRSGPSQGSPSKGKFRRGEKLYVTGYSSNYESFKQYHSNYAKVQTTSGRTGWIYAAFIKEN